MSLKSIAVIKNFSYALSSNLVSLVISIIITLVVPKIIGVQEYSYWQLYLFYSSYVGFLHFGWNDGIYLRYGGKEYQELNKKLFFSQFYLLVIFQIIIAIILFMVTHFIDGNSDKLYIVNMTILCMVFTNIRSMLMYILQGTNRITEYAQATIIDRVLYCVLIMTFILIGFNQYEFMIAADIIGKITSLAVLIFYCKDIVIINISAFYFDFSEMFNNIRVGIKLMVANIASMLIVGTVRLGIEKNWNIVTFGKVSLTLSISNLLLLFINAVGVIMFPLLRRVEKNKLSEIYLTTREVLMLILFGFLVLFFPIKSLLTFWLPAYSDSAVYIVLLLPMCVYEGKMSLLINTYLKSLREEKALLKINLTSLGLSGVFTLFNTIIYPNLNLAIVSIVIILAFRCIVAELFLAKLLEITVYLNVIIELLFTIIFISAGWYFGLWASFIIYMVTFGMYVLIRKREITNALRNLTVFFKK